MTSLPPGTYYIGDLCYVMDTEWDEIHSLCFPDDGSEVQGSFSLNSGVRFAKYFTAYGDGVYYDQTGHRYLVDSGSIGCVRLDDVTDPKDRIQHGNVVVFTEPFETSTDGKVITIGHLHIDTDPPSEDEGEYADSEYEE